MIIYKYLDEKGAFETVKENAVLLKTPLEFNDPFDCLFFVDKKEEDKAYKLFVNYRLFKSFYSDMVVGKKKAVRFKLAFKVFKFNIQQEAKNIKETKRFTFQPYLEQYYKFGLKAFNKTDTELRAAFKDMIKTVMKKIRSAVLVSCFGSSNDSLLMWAHYGNKHKGACIQFEVDDKDFKTVTYKKELPVYNFYDTLEVIFGHDFLKEEVDVEKDEYKFIYEPLFIKSIDWEYEGETRCIYSLNKRDPKIYDSLDDNGNPIILLKMPKIKAVYFGCNCKEETIKKIREQNKSIQYYKMKIKDSDYGLVPFKI